MWPQTLSHCPSQRKFMRQSIQGIALTSLVKKLRARSTCIVTPWLAASWKWHPDMVASRQWASPCARVWGHPQSVCPPHSPTALTCSRPTRRQLKELDGGNQRRDRHRNPRTRVSNTEEWQHWRAASLQSNQTRQKQEGQELQKEGSRK